MSAIARRTASNGKNSAAATEPAQAEAAFVVGIAFSAGGLQPLLGLIAQLPANLPASVIVIQHLQARSQLPTILRRFTGLSVKFAEDGETLHTATAYVAPPDRHLFLTPERKLGLSTAPAVHHMRPSADWFFDSMAASFGKRSIAVVLSGRLCDGARGAASVRRAGGRVMAQAPTTCRYPSMPLATINGGDAERVLSPVQLGRVVRRTLSAADVDAELRRWIDPFAGDHIRS